ncbi:MAG: hypothetical protein P8Z80_01365 [Pseudolabrys sp.]|jgi:hypothetical protein
MLDFIGKMFGGRLRSNLSVPILDGVFKPNNLLEQADVVLERPGLEDMALAPDGTLHLARGPELLALEAGGETRLVRSFDGGITALAFLADGRWVVGLGDRVEIEGRAAPVTEVAGHPFMAITALSPTRDGRLLICDGSSRHPADQWQYDLMDKQPTGRLVALRPASGEGEVLAGRLGWPYGVHHDVGGAILFSESWRHRLRMVGSGDATAELPGYPARITHTADGGFWLSLFSGRMQIVEFVLSENGFRRDMMATIDPKYWISPAYASGEDFLEPLQSGGVKQMGILKPWAPPRSYGLAVRYSADRLPLLSIHSRVGGRNHGIATTLERGDDVFALSKGAGRLLRLSLEAIRAECAIAGGGQ